MSTRASAHRPKAVIFDLGKVLLDFDFGRAARALAPKTKLPSTEVQKHLDQSPLLHQYESGRISAREFFEQFCALSGYSGGYEEFAPGFADIFTPIEPMIQLAENLAKFNIPRFVLSNTNDLAVEHIRRTHPFFHGFDGYLLSYEVGVMKPHDRIYEATEAATGLAGADLLFIDDKPENIETALKRGWQGIIHRNPPNTLAELSRVGVPLAKG